MQGMYNMRSPAVKRLMKEAQELHEPTEQYFTQPLEDNLFEWHFTLRGPSETEFDGGLYHGRIILPPDYPMKPPSIIILTPNGRFETNKKICLSISGHHPESWQPSWSIRTAMLAIIGFMPTHGGGALGSLDYTPDERKILAKRSRDWKCPNCERIDGVLKPVTEASEKTQQEARELAAQMDFKNDKERQEAVKAAEKSQETTSSSTDSATPKSPSPPTPVSTPQAVPPMFPPPFSQFPFMPPFPGPGQQPRQTSGATQVPRFPLPFVSPMFPPMPQYMMQNAAFGVPPFGPGMPVPPFPPGNIGMGTRPPAVPPTREDITARERTPPISPESNIVKSSETTNTAIDAEETDATASAAGTTQTTETSNSSTTPNVDTNSGVRQRNVNQDVARNPINPPNITRVNRNAEIRQEPPSLPGVGYLLFVGTILTIIALLIFRRLHMMKYLALRF